MRTLFLIVLIGMLLMAGGCAHYRVGTPGGASAVRSVYLEPVVNRSYAPQARALLDNELRQAFISGSRLKLAASAEEADWIIQVVLTRAGITPVATGTVDTGRAISYDERWLADLSIVTPQGEMIVPRLALDADVALYASGGLVNASRDSQPLLARELARRVRASVESLW